MLANIEIIVIKLLMFTILCLQGFNDKVKHFNFNANSIASLMVNCI